MELTGEEIDALRAFVNPFCKWATLGGKDSERHPSYRWVTGGRDFGPGYSSCADLAHCLLYCVGIRLPWVNTHLPMQGDMGKPGFDYQVNIDRLFARPPEALRRVPRYGDMLQAGDILICGNHPEGHDFHVMVALEHDGGERLLVAEYGQPGGHVKMKELFELDGALYIRRASGAKKMQRWLRFDELVTVAAAAGKLELITYPPGVTL